MVRPWVRAGGKLPIVSTLPIFVMVVASQSAVMCDGASLDGRSAEAVTGYCVVSPEAERVRFAPIANGKCL